GDLFVFMLFAAGIAPLVSASICATAWAAAHATPWAAVWFNVYVSNALGMIIVAPFLLSLSVERWRALLIKELQWEVFGVLTVIFLVAVVVAFNQSFLFVAAPVLLFATFRFGVMGAAAGTLVFAVTATVFIVNGSGLAVPLQADVSERILALQNVLA